MSCLHPLCASVPPKGKGKPIIIGDMDVPSGVYPHEKYGFHRIVYLPCGNCLACRRERRMDLTVLQACEASLSPDENWFLTLTYDDERTFQLTDWFPYSLEPEHLSQFCESMRKYCSYHQQAFRFFACGEYGEKNGRPHYHMSIFNLCAATLGLPFDVDGETSRRIAIYDMGKVFKLSQGLYDENGNEFWQSSVVSKFWPFGNHKIYRANKNTFQYVAGYVTKKLTGLKSKERRLLGLLPEFQKQSRPSIGYPWFSRYVGSLSQVERDKLVNDCVSVAGIDWRCPRIFNKWLLRMDQFDGEQVVRLLSDMRRRSLPDKPDRQDLKRISQFERYRAESYRNNNTHKEVI